MATITMFLSAIEIQIKYMVWSHLQWLYLLYRLQKSNLDQAVEVNHPFDGTGMLDEDEENFQKALALSRHEIDMEDEEADLRRAIQLSMQGKMLVLKIYSISLEMILVHSVVIKKIPYW